MGMKTKRARGKCIANALVCQLCWTFLFLTDTYSTALHQCSLGGVIHQCFMALWWYSLSVSCHYCRWQELVDKMFEALSVTSCDIQREIISCISEVIDDMQHVDVAYKLKWVLNVIVLLPRSLITVQTISKVCDAQFIWAVWYRQSCWGQAVKVCE